MEEKLQIELYRRMALIRRFEEKVEDLFTGGALTGTVHACAGQEATAVGACAALRSGDAVTSNHRGHGHFIAKGGDPKRIMAELFGKATGYSGGRGGSQFMADYSIGFYGGNGIVGGSIPLAAGLALQMKRDGESNVTLCFLGEGAVNQGTFHETLNMAGLWKLPVIFLCENNLYAMSTPASESFGDPDVAAKAASYGMPGEHLDGNDLLAVMDAVAKFVDLARNGAGPALIECATYRFSGHSRGDQRVYRTRDEEDAWKEKEPIRRFREWLLDNGVISKDVDGDINADIDREVAAAIQFAEKSPLPDPKTLMEGVYA